MFEGATAAQPPNVLLQMLADAASAEDEDEDGDEDEGEGEDDVSSWLQEIIGIQLLTSTRPFLNKLWQCV